MCAMIGRQAGETALGSAAIAPQGELGTTCSTLYEVAAGESHRTQARAGFHICAFQATIAQARVLASKFRNASHVWRVGGRESAHAVVARELPN